LIFYHKNNFLENKEKVLYKKLTKLKFTLYIINKTFSVLEVLLQKGSAMNMTEISKKLDLYPSTTHRILDTLKHWGYVEQEPDNQEYQLGLKVLELGMAKLQQIDLVREATP
jgi:DNA-binding IclR family transcriptional regulator